MNSSLAYKQGYGDNQPKYIAALYTRISQEDRDSSGESGSIENQKAKLLLYAKENGIYAYDIYVDDGYSGTTFDRPAFKRMIKAIEAKKVNCVIVKDLSRLGRDHLMCGQYTENYFPQKGVRFIAIDSNVDSANDVNNDMLPFLHIFNEYYPKDISRKTRSALHAKAQKGQFVGTQVPFGYKRNPDNKNHLLLDEDYAPFVKIIFQMCTKGDSLMKIAKHLYKEGVPTATGIRTGTMASNWGSGSVRVILRNEVYTGCIVYGKSENLSYKNKTPIPKPREKWTIVRDTHEAIISEELFQKAQEQLSKIKRTNSAGTVQIFSGKLRCVDCGNSLNFCVERKEPLKGYYCCRTNKRFGKAECTRHYITYSDLYSVVLADIQRHAKLADINTEALLDHILTQKDRENQREFERLQKQLNKVQKRLNELDTLFVKVYEDYALNRLDENRYEMLSGRYQVEQAKLQVKAAELSKKLMIGNPSRDAAQFAETIKDYVDIKQLDRQIVNQLIDKIVIGEKYKQGNQKFQDIKIHYKFVGLFG